MATDTRPGWGPGSKEALRQQFAERRRQRPAPLRWADAVDLAARLAAFLAADAAAPPYVGLYAATGAELPHVPFDEALRQAGLGCAYVRQSAAGPLAFAAVDGPAELCRQGRPFAEPPAARPSLDLAQLRAVLVPGLAFDRQGIRLGYGGGHYDRFFAQAPAHLLRLGVVADACLVEALPRQAHDLPMHWLFTPTAAHRVISCPS